MGTAIAVIVMFAVGIFITAASAYSWNRPTKIIKESCEHLKKTFPDAKEVLNGVSFTLHGCAAKLHWLSGNYNLVEQPSLTEVSVEFPQKPAVKEIGKVQFQIHLMRTLIPKRETFLENVYFQSGSQRVEDILRADARFVEALWNIYLATRTLFGCYAMILLDEQGFLVQATGLYIRETHNAVSFAESSVAAFEQIRRMTELVCAPVFSAGKELEDAPRTDTFVDSRVSGELSSGEYWEPSGDERERIEDSFFAQDR